MKKKYLYLLIVLLLLLAVFIVCLKLNDNVKEQEEINLEDAVIDKDKKIFSVWDSSLREIYDGTELISEERYIMSLVFYEKTIKICINAADICEELVYTETEEELIIEDAENIDFDGIFQKLEVLNDTEMILEHTNEEGMKLIYYFYQPAG